MPLNIRKKIPSIFNLGAPKTRLFLFIIALTIVIGVMFISFSTCLSILPYGYNAFFVHLPKHQQFCVSTPDGNVFYKTDDRGARIIPGKELAQPIYAFGESQLLEIFPNTQKNIHALQSLFEKKKLLIHAAPNNGPFESVEYLKYILRTTSPKNIVIGFNFGTDVFRIIPGWNPRNVVSLDSNQLSAVMMFPFWYELKILMERIKGKFFTSKSPDLKYIRTYYMSQKQLIRKNFKAFIILLNKTIKPNSSKIFFIYYPPYWAYTQNRNFSYIEKNIRNEFKNFVCDKNILNPLPVIQTYIAKYPNKSVTSRLFTYDRRHFRTELLIFQDKETYCVKL